MNTPALCAHPRTTSYLRRAIAVSALVCLGTSVGTAQTRTTLVAQGIEAAESGMNDSLALDFLIRGLAPALGPPNQSWRDGVLAVAGIHVANSRTALATTWLTWALRQDAPLRNSDAPGKTGLGDIFERARTEVGKAPDISDVDWLWADRPPVRGTGTLRLDSRGVGAAVTYATEGLTVAEGEQVLPPGTYRIEASAVGYQSATFTHEVLPGITTVVDVRLSAMTPGASRSGVDAAKTADVSTRPAPTRQSPSRSRIGTRRFLEVSRHMIDIDADFDDTFVLSSSTQVFNVPALDAVDGIGFAFGTMGRDAAIAATYVRADPNASSVVGDTTAALRLYGVDAFLYPGGSGNTVRLSPVIRIGVAVTDLTIHGSVTDGAQIDDANYRKLGFNLGAGVILRVANLFYATADFTRRFVKFSHVSGLGEKPRIGDGLSATNDVIMIGGGIFFPRSN